MESYYTLSETAVADIRLIKRGTHDCFDVGGTDANSSSIKPPHLFVTRYLPADEDDDGASPTQRITKLDLEYGVPITTTLGITRDGAANYFSEVGELRFEFDLCNW